MAYPSCLLFFTSFFGVGEEDELDDDDESNEEMDEDTDEFDAASNELDSIDEDQMAIL